MPVSITLHGMNVWFNTGLQFSCDDAWLFILVYTVFPAEALKGQGLNINNSARGHKT